MTEFVDMRPTPEEDLEPPPYGKPGRMLVEVRNDGEGVYPLSYEVVDYDGESSVFWLLEGGTVDYTFDAQGVFDNLGPGVYLIERAVGTYCRGDGWMTDDSEEWEFSTPIRVDLTELPEVT